METVEESFANSVKKHKGRMHPTNQKEIGQKWNIYVYKYTIKEYLQILKTSENPKFFTDPVVDSFSQFCVQYSHLLVLSRVCQNFLSISIFKVFIQKFAVQGIS